MCIFCVAFKTQFASTKYLPSLEFKLFLLQEHFSLSYLFLLETKQWRRRLIWTVRSWSFSSSSLYSSEPPPLLQQSPKETKHQETTVTELTGSSRGFITTRTTWPLTVRVTPSLVRTHVLCVLSFRESTVAVVSSQFSPLLRRRLTQGMVSTKDSYLPVQTRFTTKTISSSFYT